MTKYAFVMAAALALMLAAGSAQAGGKGGIFGDCGKHADTPGSGSTIETEQVPDDI